MLGLELLDRPEFDFPGAWLRSGEQEVHLMGIDSGSPLKEQHFAFRVDSLDSVRATLEAAESVASFITEDVNDTHALTPQQQALKTLVESNTSFKVVLL